LGAALAKQLTRWNNRASKVEENMEWLLFPVALIALCFILQTWVLPRFGIKT
jgi:hypothetical protein